MSTEAIAFSSTPPLGLIRVVLDSTPKSLSPLSSSLDLSRYSRIRSPVFLWEEARAVRISIRMARATMRSCASARASLPNYSAI